MSNLGFVFELGFNMGILSCFDKDTQKYFRTFLQDNCYLPSNAYLSVTKNETDENQERILCDATDMLLFKGKLCGENFFNEWIKAKSKISYEITYFQANFNQVFYEQSILGKQQYYPDLVKHQLQVELSNSEIEGLLKKGEMFNADTIILIKSRGKYHLCVIDNAIGLRNCIDIEDFEQIKIVLNDAIYTRRAKSSFSNLSVDPISELDLELEKNLGSFMEGLATKDKPLFKMVQAGSYANSFLKLLKVHRKDIYENLESICVVGYTDEEVSSINLNLSQSNVLATCKEIYTHVQNREEDKTYLDKVFNRIKRNFGKLFDVSQKELTKFEQTSNSTSEINISEKIEGFQNSARNFNYNGEIDTFRNIHAKIIKKYLYDKDKFLLFLTGNPGIGKTTAVIDFLKNDLKNDGYLFLYLSPRTQVNKDVEEKFLDENSNMYNDTSVYLTTNSQDECNNGDIVNFRANNQTPFLEVKSPIKFLPLDRERNSVRQKSKNLVPLNDGIMQVKEISKSGVIKRLATGIKKVISSKLSNQIVATATIQSLKKVARIKTTAKNLKIIFDTFYNERTNMIDEKKAEEFITRFPNIVIMIDEITGDESGVAFLDELIRIFIHQLHDELPVRLQAQLNLKIIVADASITNNDLIDKHMHCSRATNDKIYFQKTAEDRAKPLEEIDFLFREKYKSVCINTNSFPAKLLNINYNIIMQTREIKGSKDYFPQELKDTLNNKIVNKALELYLGMTEKYQIIIYIQDISRLRQVEEQLRILYKQATKENLFPEKDYIMINSTLTEKQKDTIMKVKNSAKFVLITSSASRGVSFENTTHILVDVPKFNIEQNLMEILQLIYRGRGNKTIDEEQEKYIHFYISDVLYHKGEIVEVSKQRHMISIFTLLILLKISISTRIKGSELINNEHISIIPIGSKGVNGIGNTLIENLAILVSKLKMEYRRDFKNFEIQVLYNKLESILNNVTFNTTEIFNNYKMDKIVYEFKSLWNKGIVNLLDFRPFHNPKLLGNILIFKLEKEVTSEIEFSRRVVDYLFEQEGKIIGQLIYKICINDSISWQLKNHVKEIDSILYQIRNDINKNTKILREYEAEVSDDRFAAIPLVAPFMIHKFNDYRDNPENDDDTFKKILERYVKSYYSIDNVVPISNDYENFPFIIFRSGTLEAIRSKIYNNQYIFCSSELNLLNLLLLKQ
ncbi:MAG: hypothetical protein ATN36_07900 [Epulopiscium sp. Nele67-Bin005]|nr:MAG: hypothetical protein ATN36_07900 [Epulopiscium sp. Nele67-Bin005]